jgi:hypothetical protein
LNRRVVYRRENVSDGVDEYIFGKEEGYMVYILSALTGAALLAAGWYLGRCCGGKEAEGARFIPAQQEELDRQLLNMLRYNGEEQYEDKR